MANMVTLLPIEPRNDAHGMLIVEAFYNLFINGGGQSDGNGDGWGWGYVCYGDGDGGGFGKCPEEWRVEP